MSVLSGLVGSLLLGIRWLRVLLSQPLRHRCLFLSLSLVAALSVGRSQGPGPAIGLSQGSVPGSGCQVSAPVLGWL